MVLNRILMAGLLAEVAWGATGTGGENGVVVLWNSGVVATGEIGVIQNARIVTDRIFDGIGVHLQWISECPARECDSRPIVIDTDIDAPASYRPGALAFTQPHGKAHIQVLYDRIRRPCDPFMTAAILGHVLAHEIGHVLQGVCRHSDSGVMKAWWDAADYRRMRDQPLAFTSWDAELIHQGIKARNAQWSFTVMSSDGSN